MNKISAELRAKIAKLLRMQSSSNVHEAANAAAFLERLCREHGINPNEVSADYDAARDQSTYWTDEQGRRMDNAYRTLLEGVAYYYNGRVVGQRNRATGCRLFIFATEANRLQIELYTEYLKEVMEKLATDAKRAGGPGTELRSFRGNFRKGFALAIKERLHEMRQQQEENGIPETNTTALVVTSRAKMERQIVNALVKQHFPRLVSSGSYSLGTGAGAGRAAAAGVGLSRQMQTSRPLALSGR